MYQLTEFWRETWKKKELTPRQFIEKIQPGNRLYISIGCAEPRTLMEILIASASKLADVEVIHFYSIQAEQFLSIKTNSPFHLNTYFLGEWIRDKVQNGEVDYTPILASHIGDLFLSGKKHVDVALIQLSPPDEFGFCSLGIDVGFTKEVLKSTKLVIAEINPNMPRTQGDSFIHIKDVNYYVYSDRPLLEYELPEPDEIDMRIAQNITTLIRHKSCLHLGFGTISKAVLRYLEKNPTKNDLGIHSFLITDDIIPLIEKGILTCRRKNIKPEKIITSIALGTSKLFKFVHDNPYIEFQSASQVCNPIQIAANNRMVSINQAFLIDLTGQVSGAYREYQFNNGIGDTLDFMRGASYSKGGKPIIALRSLDVSGRKSSIVSQLEEGGTLLLSNGDVHYVVTEWGVAYLHGKTIRERALELINIAHPIFRQQLLDSFREKNYLYGDQVLHLNEKGEILAYPRQYETVAETPYGDKLFIRPLKMTDEHRLQDLIYSLSVTERYMRFFSNSNCYNHEKIQKEVTIDYQKDMSIGAFVGEMGSEEMVGNAAYYWDSRVNMGEVAFMVQPDWQRRGIASILLSHLAMIAHERNLPGFFGSILCQNRPAIKLIRKVFSNCRVEIENPDKISTDEDIFFTVKFPDL